TDESRHMGILEDRRILGEDRTSLRLLDIHFDRHHALSATLVEDLIEQAKHIEIERFIEAMTEKDDRYLAKHRLDRRHVVRNQKSTQGGAEDNQDFEWVPQGGQYPARHHKPTQHAGQNHHITRYFQHKNCDPQ